VSHLLFRALATKPFSLDNHSAAFHNLPAGVGAAFKFYLKCTWRGGQTDTRWPSEQTIPGTIRCFSLIGMWKRRLVRRIWDFGTEITSNGCSSCQLTTRLANKGGSLAAYAANKWQWKKRIRLTKPIRIKTNRVPKAAESLGTDKSACKRLFPQQLLSRRIFNGTGWRWGYGFFSDLPSISTQCSV